MPFEANDAVSTIAKAIALVAEELRDDRDHLREIVDAIALPVTVCKRDLSYRWASKAYPRLVGWDGKSLEGLRFRDVLGKQATDALMPHFERVLAGKHVEYEDRVFFEGSGWRWIRASYTPTLGPDRVVDGWVALILDIEQQRKAREKLRESEERFRKLADTVPLLMWMGDVDGHNTFFNAAYAAFAGIPEPQLRQRWDALIHPDDRPEYLAGREEALAHCAEWRKQVRLLRHDGVYRWFEVVAVPRFEGDRFKGYAGCAFDVTERKLHEDATIEADHQKDEFIAVLGHELRNPMAAISNAVAILEGLGTAGDGAKRPIEIIRRQLNHLVRLTDDLLDVARVAGRKIVLAQQPVDIAEAVKRAMKTLESGEARFHRIEIDAQPAWVEGDPVRLEQIAANLLDNAVKFTPRQGEIKIDVCAIDGRAILRVSDSGMGIRKEFLPRIFQPFAQAEPGSNGPSGGLGLGLTLVKRLVEMHGGDITAQSAGPGRGATFVVSLPSISEPPSRPAPRITGRLADPRRVIIIEDNEDIRETLVALLRIAGHEAASAADAAEGIERALTFSPHVALVDLGLPTTDGYEVARHLRGKFDRAIRIIAVSGFGSEAHKVKAQDAGFDAFLVKPVDTTQLLELIEHG
jgi:PAS domain S-box-containing protein